MSVASRNVEGLLKGVAEKYAALQEEYKKWAEEQEDKTHEEIVGILKKGLHFPQGKADRRREQKRPYLFCRHWDDIETRRARCSTPCTPERPYLFCSHWNSVTVPILQDRDHGELLDDLKTRFDEAVNYSKESDTLTLMRYLLFFIHPVRHELWFYQEHYANPDCPAVYGYLSRMKHEIYHGSGNARRFKRNLNTAREEYYPRVAKDPEAAWKCREVKGCCTGVLKSLLLHPSTERWWSQFGNLTEWQYDYSGPKESLSEADQKLAVIFATHAAPTDLFNFWLKGYAQCAINEGPIFTLQNGTHEGCHKEVADLLTEVESQSGREEPSQTQKKLRKILGNYYHVRLPEEA